MYTFSEIKKKTANYCVYQDRSHYEVEQKLREYSFLCEEERGDIIIWLIQNNFLNEERFSRSYVRGKFYLKNWGKNKIIAGLKHKRIPENLINIGLQEIDETDYINKLNELAEKKWLLISDTNTFTKKKKLSSFLIQKGYESFLIYEVLNNF